MTTRNSRQCVLAGLAAIAVPAAAYAVPYTPPQAQLAAAVDLTGAFGGGGVVTNVQPAAGGALYTGNFDNMNGGSLGFSRIVLQRGGFNQDLSSFSSFDVNVYLVSNVTGFGVKMFMQNGPSFTFIESPFVGMTQGVPVLVSRDFHDPVDVPDTNNVRQFGFQFFGPPAQINDVSILVLPTNVAPPSGDPTWSQNKSGDWNSLANWSTLIVPNAVDAKAIFAGASTAAHTVFTDAPVTVGLLKFDNASSYQISGQGALNLDVGSGSGSVSVLQGSHKINLPLTFSDNTAVTVAAGATLTLGNPTTIKANQTVTKSGNLQIQAPLTLEAGASLVTVSGVTSLFGTPSLGAGAQVDVRNNGLAIEFAGLGDGAAAVRTQLVSGYNGGSWNGSGINSATAATNPNKFGVGYARATELFSTFPATFMGQPVTATSVLVRQTINGDSDLSGKVDLTDFTFLAANFNKTGGATWLQGDYNYDGNVNLSDFTYLAANFNQSVPADGGLGAMVPEPATMSLAGIFAVMALTARRSRRN